MRHAIICTLALCAAAAAAGCYGPDEATSTLSVTLRYATGSGDVRTGATQSDTSYPGAPFDYSLDTYRVAAILDVSGGSISAMSVPVLDSRFASMTDTTGQVQESFDVPSGERLSLTVTGFSWDGGVAPVAFATQAPVEVYTSGPAQGVDLTPAPLTAGTVSCWVTLQGQPVKDGTVFIVDQATRIAFPAVDVAAIYAGQGAWYDVAGVPLGRTMEMHYADAAGGWHAGGSFTLTGAAAKLEFAL